MSRFFKQAIRGCGTLPHVGEHPGTGMFVMLTLATGAACSHGESILGLLVGVAMGVTAFGPIYLYGAYDRANISDRLSLKEDGR